MTLPRLTSLSRVITAEADITFIFQSEDGQEHEVRMAYGVLNALLAPITSALTASTDRDGADIQPLTLTAARPAVLEDGTPILELHLDRIPVRMALPQSAIGGLRNVLSELERLTAGPTPNVRH